MPYKPFSRWDFREPDHGRHCTARGKNSPGLQARSNLLDSCHAASDTEMMHLLKGGVAAAAVINGSLSQCRQLHSACADRKLHSPFFAQPAEQITGDQMNSIHQGNERFSLPNWHLRLKKNTPRQRALITSSPQCFAFIYAQSSFIHLVVFLHKISG